MNELVFFAKPNFQGKHHHIFDEDNNLSKTYGATSPQSIIVKSGKWEFYSKANFSEVTGKILGPGMYNLKDEGITAKILSTRTKEEAIPTLTINEAILFKGAYFRGNHHHIYGVEKGDGDKNLANTAFDNQTSSVIIISGIWGFFDSPQFEWTEFNRLGPGMYAKVSGFNITNDRLTSVMLYKTTEELRLDEVILYSNFNLQGSHHHVYCNDPDLTESDMQNVTSSIMVIKGNWKFFGAPDFKGAEYWEDQTLGPGRYRDVTDYNIGDNVITSVRIGIDPPLLVAEPKPA